MFNFFSAKNIFLKKFNNTFFYVSNSLTFFSFKIIVNGRIFKFVKRRTFFKFNLPVVNRPFCFFGQTLVFKKQKTKTLLLICFSLKKKAFLWKYLMSIKKPSIFSKRGFHLFKKILFKKKGKITTYITNK